MPIEPNNRYGRLTVLSRETSKNPLSRRGWLCRCDCGKEKIISYEGLRSGGTRSCGCLRSETTSKRTRVHGKRNSPEFSVWAHMRQRCSNPNDKHYKDYGGRGIRVCDRWDDFSSFLEDMGERPSPKHKIERIKNDEHYEKGNCKWATDVEQANNRRGNVRYNFRGSQLTVRELWAYATNGISLRNLRARISEHGWEVESALTRAVKSSAA